MYFSKSYELDQSTETVYRLIETYTQARQLKKAMAQLEQIRDENINQYYILKATIYEKAKHYDEAIETLEEAIEVCGPDRSFYLALAKLYREDKQIIKAIESVTKVVESYDTDDSLVYEMALIAKQAGRYKEYHDKIEQLIDVWKKEARYRLTY
jgi:tetratricopeptide (TPR) repeat protein